MNTYIFSDGLKILGIGGILLLLLFAGLVFWHYRGSRTGSFRWHLRMTHLKHLSALACLFFLAMAASYAVLFEPWAILYLIIAFKAGTWWLRISITQHA